MSGGHKRFREQLPAYSLGALDPAERTDLEHHLSGCDECRAELAWLEPAADVLAADVAQVSPSPDLRSRVMAAVDVEIEAAQETESDRIAPAATDSSRSAEKTRTGRTGWFSGLFRPAMLGAVAAALFVGALVGVAIERGDQTPSGPERQVIAGSSTIGADAVMIASDDTGTLKMTGLKPLDENQVYQAWVQRGQSVEATDSLFVPRRNGTATASIPDLNGVNAVMVSAEPMGGSEQPTTAPVITVSMPG